MPKARVKLPDHLLDLPRSKWEQIIEEYIRDEDDRYIATRYYLDGVCLADIAEELVSDDENPKSLSFMKRHKAKILKIISRHLNEL